MVDDPFYTVTGELSAYSSRDLEVFGDFWPHSIRMYIEEPYGPVDGDIRGVEKHGTCVSEVVLEHKADGNIQVVCKDDRGLGMTVHGVVLISATHPTMDLLLKSTVLSKEMLRSESGYRLILADDGSAELGTGTWTLDWISR